MEQSLQNTFGTRLKLARKMAGMSLQDLSDALENKVSKQALNKYEQGLMNPTSEVLLLLAKTLTVKPEYFIKKDILALGEILFRKRTSLSKRDEDKIVEQVRDYVERYLEIENILAIENKFENPLGNLQIINREQVEGAAKELRRVWSLGSSPINNIVEVLEQKGIKVYLIDTVNDFDGMAVLTSSGIPVLVVNTKGKSTERIRFTIVHELAHLILDLSKFPSINHKLIEDLCHYFSTCFLIPTEKLIEMIGGGKRNYIYINELITIKEYYGISIRAIVHRLKQLSVITDTYYQRWVIYMSKTFGAKEEPGEYKGEEKTKGFSQLISRALSEGIVSISKAASLCNTDVNSLRKQFINVG
jgi:Zn-dependent peptidase ImmA (M78 family)/DNA-binding XRE family transcriptional regulator